jgi:hypothetical protein
MVGTVTIGAKDGNAVEEARRRISLILDPPTADVGAVYAGKVVNITKFGAFVNVLPGRDGLLHISKLSPLAAASGSTTWRTCSPRPAHRGAGRRHRPAGQGLAVAGLGAPFARRPAGSGTAAGATAGVRTATAATATAPTAAARQPGDPRRRRLDPAGRRGALLRGRLRGRAGGRARRPRPRRRSRPRAAAAVAAAAARPAAARVAVDRNLCSAERHPPGHRDHGGCPLGGGGYWVGSGSRDESDELAGRVALPRAPLFKGTPTRSAAAIAEALDEVGGDCNAFTTKEYTTFYVRLLSEHLPLGLDILSEIMWDPALRPPTSTPSAGHPRRDPDARRRAGRPGGRAVAVLAVPGHPLGRDTLGTQAPWAHWDADDIRRFFEHHYRPATWWSRWPGTAPTTAWRPTSTSASPASPGERPRAHGPGARHRSRCTWCGGRPSRPTCVYGVRSVSRFDERRWALAVLNHVLGGGLSSRLFQKIREERGWPTRCGRSGPPTRMPGRWPSSSAPPDTSTRCCAS